VLTVLMNAGPWLPVPPQGYGGIENVIATLVPCLREKGVRVVLATVRASRLPVDDRIWAYQRPQFDRLSRPYNQVMGVAHAHMRRVLAEIRHRPIDLVHDHVEVVGLGTLAEAGLPVLHTLHWDLAKHPEFYGQFDGRVSVNGVSAAQLARAPERLRAHSLGHVHVATPLAGRTPTAKGTHTVLVGRITKPKGQDVAVRLAHKLRRPLVLAGPVGPYQDEAALTQALKGDLTAALNPDVRYWCDEVAGYVDGETVRWAGTLAGTELEQLVATARAALFPVQWEEPGGTAVVEALALGTPVVGFRRGCLPELVDHGHTGLLAEPGDEAGLATLLGESDAIDPAVCCRIAARRFAPDVMAARYLELYRTVLAQGDQCGFW
jgi:glycosyltransferase involved in cell wall biosynthesis